MSHVSVAAVGVGKLRDLASRVVERLDKQLGGPARRTVVLTVASVLALDSADKATIGATSTQLQHAFSIG